MAFEQQRDGGLFVVISGIPGSGKTTVARALAPLLGLPIIDKDDILERLFDEKGIGDLAWRRQLSREADSILEAEVLNARGAIVVSFWNVAGMSSSTGTPTAWLKRLEPCVIHIQCWCPPEIAAQRYLERKRHPGHLDASQNADDVFGSIGSLSKLEPPEIGTRVVVDTTQSLTPQVLLAELEAVAGRPQHSCLLCLSRNDHGTAAENDHVLQKVNE